MNVLRKRTNHNTKPFEIQSNHMTLINELNIFKKGLRYFAISMVFITIAVILSYLKDSDKFKDKISLSYNNRVVNHDTINNNIKNNEVMDKISKDDIKPDEMKKLCFQPVKNYTCFMGSDKDVYHIGDTVYIRVVTVDSISYLPRYNDSKLKLKLTIFDMQDKDIASLLSQWKDADSISLIQWSIPSNQKGGKYKLKLESPGCNIAEHNITILTYHVPKLTINIRTDSNSYNAGDEVRMNVDVRQSGGSSIYDAKITVTGIIDDITFINEENFPKLDVNGSSSFKFKLPKTIKESTALITVIVNDGANVESNSKTLIINNNQAQCEFYPEGGDMIDSLPQTIYYECLTLSEEPIDISGQLIEIPDKVIVKKIKTKHEGRGKFVFTPKTGVEYALKLRSTSQMIKLPPSVKAGVVMTVTGINRSKISLIVMTTKDIKQDTLVVCLFRKQKVLNCQSINKKDGTVEFDMRKETHYGVLRVLVQNINNQPYAERLVYFRFPGSPLVYSTKVMNTLTNQQQQVFLPGDKVSVIVSSNMPVNMFISVTNQAVNQMIPQRKRSPLLVSQILFENEVYRFDDPQSYLNNEEYIDLLLGTQGWRRFAEINSNHHDNLQEFLKKYKNKARQLFDMVTERDRNIYVQRPNYNALDKIVRNQCQISDDHCKKIKNDIKQIKLQLTREYEMSFHRFHIQAMFAGGPRVMPMMMMAAAPIHKDVMFKEGAPPLAVARKVKLPHMKDNKNIIIKHPPLFMPPRIPQQPNIDNKFHSAHGIKYIREFAHLRKQHRKNLDIRSDFTETILWSSRQLIGNKNYNWTFEVSDSIATYDIYIGGISNTGCLAEKTSEIYVKKVVYSNIKLPSFISSFDVPMIPISIINDMKTAQSINVDIYVTGAIVLHNKNGDSKNQSFVVNVSNEHHHIRRYTQLKTHSSKNSKSMISIRLKKQSLQIIDINQHELNVIPAGFPKSIVNSGMLSDKKSVNFEFDWNRNIIVPFSVNISLNMFPSPQKKLTQALAKLIKEPFGCFEQLSATSYPLVMAQQYFDTQKNVPLELRTRTKELLAKSYEKLIKYETKDKKGYEWFGKQPAHEALTAYGLMQFTEMKKVYPKVSHSMIKRTTNWLLSRQNSNDGFLKSKKAIDSFGHASDIITDAYILWSLTYANISMNNLKEQTNSLIMRSQNTTDPYLIGLIAGILYNQMNPEAKIWANKLVPLQQENGSIEGAKESITCSRGNSLLIETTSIGILVWFNDQYNFITQIEKAVRWLVTRCEDGRFGSTQGTVLALKALILYDTKRSHNRRSGKITVRLNGKFIQNILFKESAEIINLPDLTKYLDPTINKMVKNKNRIELIMENGWEMPYSISIEYNDKKLPISKLNAPITMTVALSKPRLREGDSSKVRVKIRNTEKQKQGMVVASIGIPAGVNLIVSTLENLMKDKTIDFYETSSNGQYLILYWRGMQVDEEKNFAFDIQSITPGEYIGAANSVYLYYMSEVKFWQQGLKIIIRADIN